ncbi:MULTISPECIES: RiPP peptide [Actinomycetes]|uniref:RiPP peptide n=1 Tax=Actinomycetes TaxID=1760 RepID=UPI0001B5469A|nr:MULTISPECIES: RiPP peptide [Actinomycetes]EFL12353.1 predicted protein [Streptomyces sp. AA4]
MNEFDTQVEQAFAEDVTVEELGEVAGAGTTNTGGTISSTTCPACIGTAFSWS